MFALPFFGFSESLFRVAIRLAPLQRASLRLRGDGLTQSVVLLRPDFPEIDTSQARGRARRSRRRDFGDDTMNGSAAIADDKRVVDDPVRGSSRDIWNIQIDLLAPGAVGIYRVTAGLARSKVERAGRSQPIAGVIDLRKTSFAVKSPDADDDIQGGKRENRERVIPLEGRD
jgi:hypothetical protein